MAGKNDIPERLINYNVYSETGKLMGIATVELPELEQMSETVSGAGIAGELETPTMGHFGSMTTTFSWRTIEKEALILSTPIAHMVDIRGSQQVYDAASGVYSTVPVRVSMRIVPKNLSLGSFEPGATTDTEQEFEVMFLNILVDNLVAVTIDKLNFVCAFNGVDVLAPIRKDLGLN